MSGDVAGRQVNELYRQARIMLATLGLPRAFTDLPERRAEAFGTVVLHGIESWEPLPATVDPALLARLVATRGGGEHPG